MTRTVASARRVIAPWSRHAPIASMALAISLLVLAAPPAAAQDAATGNPLGGVMGGVDWRPTFGLHVGSPQQVSASAGAMFIMDRFGEGEWESGPIVVVEPGIDAGKLRLGYAASGPLASRISAEGAVLRAWGNSAWARPSRNYLGAELHGSVMYVDLAMGAYRTIGGSDARWRLAWSVGIAY